MIEYNDIELLEDDPNYHECPECGEELDEEEDGIFYCSDCDMYFNADGEEIDNPYEDEDDDE
jgi:ribosomal protein L37AE/L43A